MFPVMKLVAIALSVWCLAGAAEAQPLPRLDADAACDLVLPKPRREALFPRARREAHRLAHGAVCAFSADRAAALVVVACPDGGDDEADAGWSDITEAGGGVTGTALWPGKTSFVQLFDRTQSCVVTVQASGAWIARARDAAASIAQLPLMVQAVRPAQRPQPSARPPDAPTVVVRLTDAGVSFEGTPVSLPELEAMVSDRLTTSGDLQVVISAGPTISHNRVVDVMERLKARGVRRFALSGK